VRDRPYTIITAPMLRGKLVSEEDGGWPLDMPLPRARGEPTVHAARYALHISLRRRPGSAGSYIRFCWYDLELNPTGAISYGPFLLLGEHDVGLTWSGKPLAVGFGVTLYLPTDPDWPDEVGTYTWEFRGLRRLPRDWGLVTLLETDDTNPVVKVSGVSAPEGAPLAAGGFRREGGPRRLLLGFDPSIVRATLQGTLTLAETLRSPVAFFPEFDETTLLSIPFTRCSLPEIGSPPLPLGHDGYPLMRHERERPEMVRCAHRAADRLDRRLTLYGTTIEEAFPDATFSLSSPSGENDDWTTRPEGSGDQYDHLGPDESFDPIEPSLSGAHVWRKGSEAEYFGRTFTSLTAGDTVSFSVYVRGCAHVILSLSNVSQVYGDTETVHAPGEGWRRLMIWGVLTDVETEITINQGNEGDVMEFAGYQFQVIPGDAAIGGEASSLVPRFLGEETRAAASPEYVVPMYGDRGTVFVVCRWSYRGGGVGWVPLLTAYDPDTPAHLWLFCFRSPNDTNEDAGVALIRNTDATTTTWWEEIASPGLPGDLLHLVWTWEPEDDSGVTKTRIKIYHDGSLLLSALTDEVPDMLGERIVVAPSEDLPTIDSDETVPYAGTFYLVRYDQQVWDATEIARHYQTWSGDFGRDLLYLSQGRRFEASVAGGFAPTPGAEIYSLSSLRLRQIGEFPPEEDPTGAEMYERNDP